MHRLISSRLTDRMFIWLSKCAKDIHYYCNNLSIPLKDIFVCDFLPLFLWLKQAGFEVPHSNWGWVGLELGRSWVGVG